ncbi:MAG: enoyl-CoA hydratase/isomerase family protein [Chloroflexi bacterium]|nr:enoyl-CoA hydratase/isomerase family protein [Chloroflexota bacterium]MCH8349598.1 enoyl-CoA hydratase/isomerase family protein [Chloroflexota bacterium]MCI0780082.1 enoyl-CoA hydratase/isomerase family protein [Chloroflexota bacterium]MCI0784813.1 enoyl-CoA hydratase/isomerase family protein [Chloroflexota bacterium]MCI0792497.1 enoyl-CoA hydratase/isomerase family protein [Chloroflexota bacterium]
MPDYNYNTLLVDKKDQILTITLNRPERLNAVDEVMHGELEDVFATVGRDGEVSAVVLTGAGRGFCSGGDVRAMDERGGAIALQHRPIGAVSISGRRLIHNMLWVEQPMICALNGVAAGLGATIALFCDIIYASDQARIGDTHVRAGLVAGDGGAVIWPALIGMAKAKELLMTGDIIDAQEAERIGLINKVVPHDDLMDTVMALAKRLATGPALAIRGTKHALNKRIWSELNLSLDMGLALEERSSRHDDHKEAAKAFVEKRTPQYKGTI